MNNETRSTQNVCDNSNIRVAIITQTYYRKDGSSKKCLKDMFKMLEAQTYKKFKVFITGDNYQPESEFLEVCYEYKGEIYIHNNNHSCRELNLGTINNYWCYGGIHASYNSYTKAKAEGYDLAIMLDDDDFYFPTYIQSVVDNFTKFPETAFMITKSQYCGSFLPRTRVNEVYYNNYIPTPCDSVRSSHVHNINIISDEILEFGKNMIDELSILHIAQKKWNLYPGDAGILAFVGKKVKEGVYKSLYIPSALVRKESDRNTSNIK